MPQKKYIIRYNLSRTVEDACPYRFVRFITYFHKITFPPIKLKRTAPKSSPYFL